MTQRLIVVLAWLLAPLSVVCAEPPGSCKPGPAQHGDDAGSKDATDFGGDLCTRPKLTGNWLDLRPCLAAHGITFDADVVQFYAGVTSGGLLQRFDYAGHSDGVLNVDFDKLIGWKGLSLKVRAEDHFGRSINGDTGAIVAAYLLADTPPTATRDVLITDFLFTQKLSKSVGIFAGKLDTLNEPNAFASGRGDTQFSNSAFLLDPAGFQLIPYSCLGTGLFINAEKETVFTLMVLNPIDTSSTIGFPDLFRDGVLMVSMLRLPYRLGELPGHQAFFGVWTSRTYFARGGEPYIVLPNREELLQPVHGSWSLFWNMDQYLVVDPNDATKGWGLFARAAIADGRPNPLRAFYSIGLGGNSPIHSRAADIFGIGWFYSQGSNTFDVIGGDLVRPQEDGQGIELFYNVAVTPWFHLTADSQFLRGGLPGSETAVVVGLRAKIDF